MKIETLLTVIAIMLLTACGKSAEDLAWRQEVPLQDGRVIVLERLSHIGAEDVLQRLRMETEQTLTFTHPDNGQRIEWKIPKGLLPFMLDFDSTVPYYVFYAHTGGDYNRWNCPNPPYMVFRYGDGQWKQIPVEELPARLINRNLLDMAKANEKLMSNRNVEVVGLQRFLAEHRPEQRIISREKVSPISVGCFPDVLVKQGRESEINAKYRLD